jgi:cell division protein FtsZ
VEAASQAINSPLMEEGGVLGARGVLINITASSQLGIHDVHEACSSIRTATQNDDVQINFGVVLEEKMGASVKITVIATGFHRDTLPEIDRRNPHFPFTAITTPEPPQHEVPPAPEVEPQIVVQTSTVSEPVPEEPADDFDTPAFLRRQRRMVQ